jgi:hypothetical protein
VSVPLLCCDAMYCEPRLVKAAIALVFMAAATSLFVYGTVAPLVYINSPTGAVVSLWELCFQRNSVLFQPSCRTISTYDCEEQHDQFSSARAFCIIAIIFSFATFIFSVFELMKYRAMTKWRVMLCFFTVITGATAWGICLSFYTQQMCALFGKPLRAFAPAQLGASVPALVAAWALSLITFGFEFLSERRFACWNT